MHKFNVMITAGQMHMDDNVRARMTRVTRGTKDGPHELLLREEVKWDTDQMRKYFHVLCKKFFKPIFKQKGTPYGEREIKAFFKYKYGPVDDMGVPESTSTYDFKTYTDFISDLNAWSIEHFECELPAHTEIEGAKDD